MTVLYRPVLIESAEQAEALPIGTVALLRFGHRTKTTDGWWETPTGGGRVESRVVVGALALVPIEVEVETREHPRRHEDHPRDGETYLRPATLTRYVTPWEEA